jgi:sterol desaturase/sphingolipid hydroxylase (fatty acid hydroxylase superfamily)
MFEVLSGQNPFSSLVSMFIDPQNRWFLGYFLCSITIAIGVFLVEAVKDRKILEGGLTHYLFPTAIYLNRSAVADYWFFLVNKLAFALVFAQFAVVTAAAESVTSALLKSFIRVPAAEVPSWVAVLATTLAWALAADFGLWGAHYLQHRIPILWEFHKVHHSAEVLTPVTAGRVHPIDDFLNFGLSGVFGGASLAVCQAAFGDRAFMFSLFNINFVLALFYLFGFHLRHSHIWLPYKGLLGKLLISPAHHQVHHSIAERHWNKNLGFMFAFWDWCFGTLYPVDAKEQIVYGIDGAEETQYQTVLALYWLPFVRAYRRIRAATPHQPWDETAFGKAKSDLD